MLATEFNKQILIVDQDVATVEPLRHSLAEVGYVVRAITNECATMAAVAQRLPHLLIIDWNVAGCIALEVLQRLRRSGLPQTVRLIILSDLSSEDHVVRG